MLGKAKILEELGKSLVIDPFNPGQLKENSYDLTLGDKLLWLQCNDCERDENGKYFSFIDPKKEPIYHPVNIPKSGLIIFPGKMYLGATIEMAGSLYGYVPKLAGRSSFARLALVPILEAGFGDVGFCQQWTLEIMTFAHPFKLYPGMRICQIYWEPVEGGAPRDDNYSSRGTYAKQEGPTPSSWWRHQDGGK